MTLEALIKKCNDDGLRVNNLFQHERTLTWQANLWEIRPTDGLPGHAGGAHDFGHGPTAIEALQRAYDVTKGQVKKPTPAPVEEDGSDLC